MNTFKEIQHRRIGIFFSYLIFAVNLFSYIFYTPFLLTQVGDRQYGIMNFISSITSWLTIITFALTDSFIRFATLEKKQNGSEKRVNTIYVKITGFLGLISLLFGMVIFIFFYFGIIPLSKYTLSEKRIINILLIISIIQVVVNTILSVFKLFVEYKKEFGVVYLASLIHTIVNLIFCFISLVIKPSVILITLITCITQILFIGFIAIYALKVKKMELDAKIKIRENKKLFKEIFIFVSFLLLNTIVTNINNSTDYTILGLLVSPVAVTIYKIGSGFVTYMDTMTSSIGAVYLPKINELAVNDDHKKLSNLFLEISKYQMIVAFLFAGGFICCGKDFITAWVGSDKIESFYVGATLLILSIVPSTTYIANAIQRALNKHKFRAITYLLMSLLNILVSVLLVIILDDKYAILGCLVGTILASFLANYLLLPIYNKKVIGLDMKTYFLNLLTFLLITLFDILLVYGIMKKISINNYWIRFFIAGSIFTIVYLLMVSFRFKTSLKKIIRRRHE